MAYSQVSYGSQGSDVKTLQEMLNQNGYNLSVDGIFGSKTQQAVRDYQQKNGLSVDGIVGNNTWGSLTTGNTSGSSSGTKNSESSSGPGNSSGATPAGSGAISYEGKNENSGTVAGPSYETPYEPSDAVKQAEAMLQQQLANKPGEYTSAWQSQLNEVIDKIMNREDFSYDLNGDALYQQYKDKYITQGKQAMMDTMGQAAALTGGYGSSYGQAVGQQAYQSHLQNLNDVVPELYQMALDQYNQKGQDLYNQYSLLGQQEEQDYGRYRDTVSDYYTQLGDLRDQYNAERDYDYSMFADNRNFAYQTERDKTADEQWQKEFDEAVRQYNQSLAASQSSSGGSGGGSSSGGSGYNNGSLTTSQVKALQKALGVTQDGKYGSISKSAAGGLSAEAAYAKYVTGGSDDPGGYGLGELLEVSGSGISVPGKTTKQLMEEELASRGYDITDPAVQADIKWALGK